MKKTIIFLSTILLSVSIYAYDFQIDDLRYTIISMSDRTVEVLSSSESMKGDVVIPAVVEYNDVEFTVTRIAENAFAYCHNIKTFTIPNTVTSIGELGFGWCWYLHTIILDNPNPVFRCGSYAFDYDWRAFKNVKIINGDKKSMLDNGAAILSDIPLHQLYIDDERITHFEVPDGTKTINTFFKNSLSLKSIVFANSVDSVVNNAFYHCDSLHTVTLSSSLRIMGKNAFADCAALRTIYSPSKAPAKIDESTFPNGAYMFAKVYIPRGASDIYKATEGWSKFTNLIESDDLGTVDNPEQVAVTGITLDKEEAEIEPGETLTLTAIVNPENADKKDVSWHSDDEDIAFVIDGVVTGVAKGTTMISVTTEDGNFSAVCVVTVIERFPVVFLNYNGEILSEQQVAYNHAAYSPEVPDRDGYTFSGWSSDIEHIVAKTFVIAMYEKIGGNVTYLSEEGNVIATENVDLHLPAAPIVAGKSFNGWLTESADSQNGIVFRATYTLDNPTTHDDVNITPFSNSAAVIFPFITSALTYQLVIRDLFGNVVCKIMFNAAGYLLGVAFAPGSNRAQQQATQTTGFNFTVEGLDANTTYEYEFVANDETDAVIETLSGSFTTAVDMSENIKNIQSQAINRKYIESGHLFINNNDRIYDALGQQVK